MNILNILFVRFSHLLSDVVNYSRYFVEDDTNVVDIGCSTGKLTTLLEENQDHCYKQTMLEWRLPKVSLRIWIEGMKNLLHIILGIPSSFCKR